MLHESHFSISGSVVSGSALAGISSQNSTISATDCTFKDGSSGLIAYDSRVDVLRCFLTHVKAAAFLKRVLPGFFERAAS